MKYGYARGWEAVQYIENVKQYYDIITFLDNKDNESDNELFNEVPSTAMTNDNLINDAFDNGINENNRDEVNSIVREIISDLDLGKVSCKLYRW